MAFAFRTKRWFSLVLPKTLSILAATRPVDFKPCDMGPITPPHRLAPIACSMKILQIFLWHFVNGSGYDVWLCMPAFDVGNHDERSIVMIKGVKSYTSD